MVHKHFSSKKVQKNLDNSNIIYIFTLSNHKNNRDERCIC